MKRILFVFFLYAYTLATNCQIQEFNFRRVSPPGGLNFQSIHCLTQDKAGNIWIGSNQGIYRYNSNGFVRYNHNPENPHSLQNDFVKKIAIDPQNKLWVVTNTGLDLFENETKKIIHINYQSKNDLIQPTNISSIGFDHMQNMWLTDSEGLGCLDTVSRLITYPQFNRPDFSPILIQFDKLNRGWVGTEDGSIFRFYIEDLKLVPVIKGPGSAPRTIFVEGDSIYVGYHNHGARVYSLDGQLIKHFEYPESKEYNLKNASIRSIFKDDRNNLWVGAYTGLYIEKNHTLRRVDTEIHKAIPNNSIYSIFQDRSGGIWYGTWSGGLFYMNYGDNYFSYYQHHQSSNSLSNNIVSSFAESPNGKIFIGTEGGGLNEFDPSTGMFEAIKINQTNKVSNIKALSVDYQGNLWVGTFHDGLWFRAKGTRSFTQVIKSKKNKLPSNMEDVYSFCSSAQGVYIGTYGKGLYFFNYKNHHFTKIYHPDSPINQTAMYQVRSVFVDSQNILWVGSNYGLIRLKINKEEGSYTELNRYPIGNVYYINELFNKQIWIGTKAKGIFHYQYKNNTNNQLKSSPLFPGKDIYGFEKDQFNRVWITSNTGLYLYTPSTKLLRHFNAADGIQGDQFNPQSIFKDKDNNMYFGGTNGFTFFTPGSLNTNQIAPNVILEKIMVNNKFTIYPKFNKIISAFEPLEFPHYKNSFKIDFASDGYLLPNKNLYKYRLKGIYNEWIDNSTSSTAVFTNIPPGTYTFEVMACNNDGIWNDIPVDIIFMIHKPFWQSATAYFIYLLLTTILAIGIYKIRNDRVNLKKALLVEKIKREQKDELHEMKLKFFTNISHEFRTPLTLISGPLNSILHNETLTSHVSDKLKIIQRNTNRLLTLINQLLDFRELEQGKTQLNHSNIDIVSFIMERYNYFLEEAKTKEITYKLEGVKTLYAEVDEEKMDKIIFNLLSNAFKHTPKGGFITINIHDTISSLSNSSQPTIKIGNIKTSEALELSITNSGVGIDSNTLPKIFTRFEKGAHNKNGTGIGLSICQEYILLHHGEIVALSTPGKETSFKVKLPLKQSANEIIYQSTKKHDVYPQLEEISPLDDSLKLKTGSPYQILVAEDNEEMRSFIYDILSPYYKLKLTSNGLEALNILQEHTIDLVLSDVMMPEFNGFELCGKIKSQIETSHIPVILLTALSSTNNEMKGLAIGANDYISKPFDEKLLLMRIHNLLKQGENIKETFEKKFINYKALETSGNLDNYFIEKSTTIIESNLEDQQFSVEKMAEEMGMSRSHLHRKLKQLTNHSPNEYIRLIRLRKAVDLMKTEQYNIEEICFRVGFNSPSYFAKCFKEVYHATPKQYMSKIEQI